LLLCSERERSVEVCLLGIAKNERKNVERELRTVATQLL